MADDFAVIPGAGSYRLANATVPAVALAEPVAVPDDDGLVIVDIEVRDGLIGQIMHPEDTPPTGEAPTVELDRGMVWPCFIDMHTHLDKAHIWPRRPNPDGTFDGALDATEKDRTRNWRAEDVARRMDFALRCALAHGTALIRTHLDSIPPQHDISWPVFDDMRRRWAGRIDLQAVSLLPIDALADDRLAGDIVSTVARHEGVFGAVTFMVPELDRILDGLMRRAAEAGLDLDFHVDETGDPAARSLSAIAAAVMRTGFPGRVVAGHCCSLAAQPDDEARATIEAVAAAGIAVVSLPMCNLYLQDRNGARTPRWRGVTLLNEVSDAGVPTAIASDNTRDPFYAYGDLDMLEVYREAVRIGHLDHPIADSPRYATRAPATIIGRPDRGIIATGAPADLVAFSARSYTELLARPQTDRVVIRNGRAIDRTLPDYRELDALMETPG